MKVKLLFVTLACLIFVISCAKIFVKSSDSADINKGLLAYYPFNGNAIDESGNQINGQVNGCELVADRFDKENSAYYFDGENDYISFSNNFNFDFNSAFSLCGWVKTNELQGLRTIFSKAENSRNSNNLYVMSIHFQYARGLVRDTVMQDINVMGSQQITDNQWHFICLTYDGSSEANGLKIFVDGEFHSAGVKRGNPVSMSTDDPAAIGCEAIGFRSRNYFHGSIDDIRIYDRAINTKEVALLYSQTE